MTFGHQRDFIIIIKNDTAVAGDAEIFRASDGSALLNTQVDQLIQAMAGFSAETGLDWTSAAQQQPEEVQTILAASWHPAG